ncbi:zinc finger MYM-type protein 1-like [Impatiens glandulifera]|uniref:zinc finger MYM-type protein 1-like n=1 Tax=Impatiens glandulifera TaxID=253017 RepID=UPI001FB19020|nr:zinc finger MYM-type protein 1-like [Impatiens glandulifera]
MYDATINVLENIIKDGSSISMRGEAGGSLIVMKSFDFIFTLHLMHKIMGITNLLSRDLQRKSIDILNAMNLVSFTKALLLKLRNDGFDILLSNVISFCTRLDVDIPEMSARYKKYSRSCGQNDTITVEHHFHYDIFNVAIDFQLEELNFRFSDDTVELLSLSSTLDPNDKFKNFNIDKILTIAKKYYPEDFTKQEMHHLRSQLQHFEIDITCAANGNTRPRCARIQPLISVSKVKDFPFNRYSWLTTHNSFTLSRVKSATGSLIITMTNQEDSVTSQLKVKSTKVKGISLLILHSWKMEIGGYFQGYMNWHGKRMIVLI